MRALLRWLALPGLALAAFRVRATSVRLFTWTAVLYAALAMPLLGRMLPPLPIPTPAFLQMRNVRQPTFPRTSRFRRLDRGSRRRPDSQVDAQPQPQMSHRSLKLRSEFAPLDVERSASRRPPQETHDRAYHAVVP